MDEITSRVLIALVGCLSSCVTAWIAAYFEYHRHYGKRMRRPRTATRKARSNGGLAQVSVGMSV